MKRVLAVLAVVGVISAALVFWLELRWARPARPPESFFHTRAEAQRAGLFTSGWMPAFVPEGATELRELHDISTTRTWGRFTLPSPGWLPPPAPGLAPSELALRGPSIHVPWWPPEADGRITSVELVQKGYRVVVTAEGEGLLCVAVRGTDVLFWRFARGTGI